ncbi:SIR2 family protein [Vibrio hibernica]|uniref:SIR2 family protein n=1 Tax=Vibrio hibernica TaxID=2587465 RepID=UPI001881039E|nr:SIR2 family protein [Vibrio hibernica]
MNFKNKLANHFNQFEASPILFVGSGLSRRYMGVNCWEGLLKEFAEAIGESHVKLRTQSNGDLPTYAQLLASIYAKKWWDTEEAKQLIDQHEKEFLDEQSPLKISIAKYIEKAHEKITQDADLQAEIELLAKANIDGVITTNWDMFLENQFPKFTPFVGQDGLIAGRSHGIAEIYKIHGCSSRPNSLVLTSTDYDKYRKKNPYLSSKLLTMFIERPVIFLGYSLTDEHIAEILEDIVNCFPEASLDFLQNKLLFVEWKSDIEEPDFSDSVIHKKIPVKYIQTPSYKELFEVLSETKKRIPAHLFRMIKDELYELVLTDDPKGKLYVRDSERIEDNVATEFVVGYGAISMVKKSESMATKGLVGLQRVDLIREVVFENKQYDWGQVVNEVLPNICKGNARIPIFHYLNQAGLITNEGSLIPEVELKGGVANRFDSDINSFRSQGGDLGRSQRIEEVKIGVNELYNKYEFGLFLRMMPYMDVGLIRRDLDELLKILKKHIDDALSQSSLSSSFCKVVCLYDYVKNSNHS